MATLLLTLTSGINVNSTTLTFNASDASRIFTAFQARVNPDGTQADLVNWVASKTKQEVNRLVMESETTITYPIPPTIT